MSELETIIDELYEVVKDRQANPKDGSYTNYLLDKGTDKICKKIGEESTEVVLAAKNNSREEIVYESADLIYHLVVLLAHLGIEPQEVYRELMKRRTDSLSHSG